MPPEVTPTVTVREYIVRGNTVLEPAEIQDAIQMFLGEGMTLAHIEQARDTLQARYQERGFQSVYVDLPEQQVSGGVVLLTVSETRIGRVRVTDARHTSPMMIRAAVPALTEGSVPDFNLVQAELTALSSGGQRQVVPVVREGRLPGTMDVDLKVTDESPWSGSLSLNNDYSADTSKLRAIATLGHDNLWQRGHSASLTLFTAPKETDDAMVWSFSYTAPLSPRWSLRFSALDSDSDVATVGGTTVVGQGTTYGLTAVYTWPWQGEWLHSVSLGVDFKDFEERIGLGASRQDVPLRYAPLTFSYTGYRFGEQSQTDLHLSLVSGHRSMFGYNSDDWAFDDKRFRASPSFTVFKTSAGYTRTLASDWQWAVNGSLQMASGPLVSNEQFSAGGASSVRGYLSAEATGDDGAQLSMEWRTPAMESLGMEQWRFHAFAEGARLEILDPLPETRWVHRLASVGLGARARIGEQLSWGVDVAWPLRWGPNTEEHDTHVHFNVRASF